LDELGQVERFPAGGTGLGEWDAGLDADPIPPRGWLLGNTFCRCFISSLMASGGTGKTALRIAQGLALATGRRLTGETVFQRCRVLIVSLEDDRNELRRRIRAAMKHHNITAADLRGWLFLATPGAAGWKLATIENGAVKVGELVAKLKWTVENLNIDVAILDPFVKTHAVEENGNGAIDFVAGLLAQIASACNCAIDAPHHIAKGAADPGNADRGRGASAFKDAARLVYTLAPMTPEEAEQFGIGEEQRSRLVRMDSAKVNLAPPATQAAWFRLVSVELGNSTVEYPAGDNVQTVEPWSPPDVWEGLNHVLLNEILTTIDRGLPDGSLYSDRSAAKERAAWKAVVQHAPDKTEQQARQVIKAWVKTGLLMIEDYTDPSRREPAKGLKVNHAKRPS
jgi:hypothetical protein